MRVLVAERFFADFALFETSDPENLKECARLSVKGKEIEPDPSIHRIIGDQDTMTAEEAQEEAEEIIFLPEIAEELKEEQEPEINIDLWSGHTMEEVKLVDIFFYPMDGEYRGNLYTGAGEIIGDFSGSDSVKIEEVFPEIFN